jgi:hypothetical protein
MKLTDYPRLYISEAHYNRLKEKSDHSVSRKARRSLGALAKTFLADATIVVDETGHNSHLIRARKMQTRVVTLLAEYKRTGDLQYRDAIMADVARIAGWEYWSWITWRQGDARPEAIFDLSYGENSATLALAFDGLYHELSDDEKKLFVDTAVKRALKPFLHVMKAKDKPSYYKHPHTNWNTVCCGGAGMLALAMGDLCKESEAVLKIVEESVEPFFRSLKGDGGWPEGIGYWNYGMRYGFMYLLSWERATGRTHKLLRLKGTEATLKFPLQFTPNGVPCSFGDVNKFSVLPFHYAAAERFGADEVVIELDRRMVLTSEGGLDGPWPNVAELALFHPGHESTMKKGAWHNRVLVRGLDWGYVADQMPDANLYVSVRGGTTDAPHVHRDLMSFFVVAGGEKLIENVGVDDYMDTTFSARRFDLYEPSAHSKNTIFLNGLSIGDKATVKTALVEGAGFEGFRMDATDAMGTMRDGPAATFCGRAILMVKNKGILVVDRVVVPHAALVESRLHSFCSVVFGKDDVRIWSKKQSLQIAVAATRPIRTKQGMGIPSHPGREPDTMIRFVSEKKVMSVTTAYFLTHNGKSGVALSERSGRTTVKITGDVSARIGFDTDKFTF